MPQATAAAIGPADAPDHFASTRANYERFAFLLLRIGHVPGLALTHLDFRVLLFLLGQKPGHYAAHHHTIAATCDSNATSIKHALWRLRDAGLVGWELVPPHHRLPTGRFTRTNVNHYRVHLPRLSTLLDAPARPPIPTGKPAASTRSEPPSSHGTESMNEQKPPPGTPRNRKPAPSSPRAFEGEAELRTYIDSDFETTQRAWEKLGLGPIDDRSKRALVNRRAEGATLEQLEAAVAGASLDDWLRRRAKVPFAVVFASLASVERFAHEGRKVLQPGYAQCGPRAQTGQQEKQVAPIEQPQPSAPDEKPSAGELRSQLPVLPFPRPPAKAEARHQGCVGGRPQELMQLLASLSGAMAAPREMRDQETPETRRRRAQEEFDRRRLETLALLQTLK